MYATCHTEGCTNQGIPIEVPADIDTLVCGVCSEPITDVTDTAPTLPEVLPSWLD